MNETEMKLDVSELPETARNELRDFYESLKGRYVSKRRESSKKSEEVKCVLSLFLSNPIKVREIKRLSREELYER